MKKELTEIDALLERAKEVLQGIIDDRTSEFDEKSAKWQESEKGTDYQEVTDSLQQAFDEIDGAHSTLMEHIG